MRAPWTAHADPCPGSGGGCRSRMASQLGRSSGRSSALRPPVTGRTFPSRTFPSDIAASVHRRRANLPISENCCWDRLEIARKGKSDKFGWSLDLAFLHNSVVIHFGLVLVARRFAFSEQEKKLIIDGSLLRSRISFSFPVVRSDSRVQFLARSCTKLSCRLLEKANVS